MNTFLQILFATFAIAAVSLIGIALLPKDTKKFGFILMGLVALSAGAMFGNAQFHLMPEALESGAAIGLGAFEILAISSAAFVLSFLFEQLSRWHHCHATSHHGEDTAYHCHIDVKPFSRLIIISDAIHNFIDGLIIAASFFVSPALGVATTLAVALHEVPQELGDYAALVYGGYSRKKLSDSIFWPHSQLSLEELWDISFQHPWMLLCHSCFRLRPAASCISLLQIFCLN